MEQIWKHLFTFDVKSSIPRINGNNLEITTTFESGCHCRSVDIFTIVQQKNNDNNYSDCNYFETIRYYGCFCTFSSTTMMLVTTVSWLEIVSFVAGAHRAKEEIRGDKTAGVAQVGEACGCGHRLRAPRRHGRRPSTRLRHHRSACTSHARVNIIFSNDFNRGGGTQFNCIFLSLIVWLWLLYHTNIK